MRTTRIDWSQMRTMRESYGEVAFARMLVTHIREGHIDKFNFSLKGLWEALGQPNLSRIIDLETMHLSEADFHESMDSSAFPKITGALISRIVQEAYEITPGIGRQLVRTLPASEKDVTIVGYTSADTVEEVIEGMSYKEGAFGEKYHKIRNRKFGRILSLTMEMIKFDQTAQMISRAANIGEQGRAKEEEIIMKAICEYSATGEYASWRPGGTSTTLYSDTSTDPYSSVTLDNVIVDALADETDLDSAYTNFQTFKDETGNYITVNPTHIVTAPGKAGIAQKLMKSTQYTVASTPTGVPKPDRYTVEALNSPWVYGLLGANYWLFGDFKKQFVYTEVFPLEVLQEKSGSTADFERDVVFRVKVRSMGGCGAITNRYVIRSTGS